MKILGIETSCDETAIAVVEATEDGGLRALANAISSQVALHAQFGGVVPALAAREHAANIGTVLAAALAEARLGLGDINLIAVTRGPGLGPALLVGLTFARTLAWRHGIPLVGVNHMDGHVHANWLDRERDDAEFPALNLIVSGGHTELVLMHGHGDMRMLGETRDDAVGEAFDKVARILDLGYPGGPAIAKLARDGDPGAYALPRPMSDSKDLDFSYSGLKTAVLYLVRDLTEGHRMLTDRQKADIAASFQQAAIAVLIRKTERAARENGAKLLLLSGGVSANTLLRERFEALGHSLGIPVRVPPMRYTTDNAAMIAAAGAFAHRHAARDSWESVSMDANLRLGHNQA